MINPIIDDFGSQHWYNSNKRYHRIDGPAYIGFYGKHEWWVDGRLHRENGPAVIYTDGYQEWYVMDKQYIDNKSFQEAANLSDEDMNFIVLKYGDVK